MTTDTVAVTLYKITLTTEGKQLLNCSYAHESARRNAAITALLNNYQRTAVMETVKKSEIDKLLVVYGGADADRVLGLVADMFRDAGADLQLQLTQPERHVASNAADVPPIVFADYSDAPAGSVGYFAHPVTGHTIDHVLRLNDGRWITGGAEFTPEGQWVFTSNSGPANAEAFRKAVVAADHCEKSNLALTPKETAIVLSALQAKLAQSQHYLSGYDCVADGPQASDECCAYHQALFTERVVQRESLLQRVADESALVSVLTNLVNK